MITTTVGSPNLVILLLANRDNLAPKGSTFQFTRVSKGSTVQFTSAGQLVLNDPGGNQIWTATASSSGNSNRSVSYAAMLDSGNFVLAATDSEILWQSFDVPTDTILPSQTLNIGGALVARYSETNYKSGSDGTGSGVCGFNSYCQLGDDRRPFCSCPQGYVLIDPNDEIKGCKPNFVAQSCNPFLETDDFEFVAMDETNWPQGSYASFSPVSGEWCRNECLNDCFCTLAAFRNGECFKKRYPLVFGRMDPEAAGITSYLKNRRNKTTIIVSVLLGSSEDPFILGVNLRIFSYEELNNATGGFIQHLGRGSFATVYKGIIDSDNNNNLVAIKKFDNVVPDGEQEFKAEVIAIARTNHKNLVRLLGFCNEGEHRMMVYEFMPNGSLADFLFGTSKPNWHSRIQIILETARGLCYLHEGCSTQTIHCDIKPQNILLDESFSARIADLGLAKLLKNDGARTTPMTMTMTNGESKGYVAPEWFRGLPITVKVDVYSFGVVLLETICCRRSLEEKEEDEKQKVLRDWGYECLKEMKVEMLVEKDEEAKMELKRVKKFVMIAIWCIQEEPSLRPSMKKVLQMMEGAIEVSFPPHPSSFISSIS
uniref:non-specific serine/threonine protein kinase n=1 Tax=Cucumis sativus TaxID=3659 RepID=A0A0A0KX79_CUCSA